MEPGAIADYMSTEFAVITPDMPVDVASAKLIQKEMLGGPVVDDAGRLVGWISEQECLHITIQVVYYNQRVATVRDVMRTDVLTVSPNDHPLELAQQMLSKTPKPKNYPVVDRHNKVIGVISRRHMLKMLLRKMAEQSKKPA
ncbi:CBS domain-containing protein [Marinobacterium nitratireducens]|uniref:CBS domain-containing protein n=1 Tax=Marinobacterium nitratireducens TaxID=518897 RepID=A0A917ZE55_9GAMM|nr:CBS domain-containing protein [Marinobacterium nitratireducens]GGO81351.1 CBS domain-containing protein [Marinobacterium nitratireducens]